MPDAGHDHLSRIDILDNLILARHFRTPRSGFRIAEDERDRSTAGNPAKQGDRFRSGQVVEAYVTVPSGRKHELASRLYTVPAAGTFYIFVDGSRSEERRVGKECVSTCKCRWAPDH